uniref:Uncharacterized protein n=1 Tax=Rhizophora mucronata TaxID=61149 RepID=A0A2P2Q6C9_RHIMU
MAVGTESRILLSLNPLMVHTLLCLSFPPKLRDTRTILGFLNADHCLEVDAASLENLPSLASPSCFASTPFGSLELVVILMLSLLGCQLLYINSGRNGNIAGFFCNQLLNFYSRMQGMAKKEEE